MPLTGDPSKDIPELERSGRPHKQAIAIALKEKRGDEDAEDCDVTDEKSKEKKELGIDGKKDELLPINLLTVVERIRNDMATNKEAIDKLTTRAYNASSRIRRLEEQK